jgi:hypothetical protein
VHVARRIVEFEEKERKKKKETREKFKVEQNVGFFFDEKSKYEHDASTRACHTPTPPLGQKKKQNDFNDCARHLLPYNPTNHFLSSTGSQEPNGTRDAAAAGPSGGNGVNNSNNNAAVRESSISHAASYQTAQEKPSAELPRLPFMQEAARRPSVDVWLPQRPAADQRGGSSLPFR